MSRRAASSRPKLAIADAADCQSIYRLRHDVYAQELGQYPPNDAARLTDDLDAFNVYFAIKQDDRVVGFISVTPPGRQLSIDKYVDRADLPFPVDSSLFEIRILTVSKDSRATSRGISLALVLAALRWIQAQGGRRIVAIGRLEVLGLYRKLGLKLLGRRVTRGQVSFELMTATTDELDQSLQEHERIFRRAVGSIRWMLDLPPFPPPACFHGGAFFDAIGDRFTDLSRRRHIINADVLDAWFPPSPKVLGQLREHLPWLIQSSPPAACSGLLDAISSTRGIPRDSLVPGAGSSDLIFRALRAWLSPASRVLILDPTYGEYAHVLEKVIGCHVERFLLDRDEGFQIDLPRLESRMRSGFDLIVLVNPNSPTGTFIDRDPMLRMLSIVPRQTRVWVDEAYIDYLGANQSIEREAAGSENLFVCKSMSKVYALSGLRAAYLCGNSDAIAQLRAITPPWIIGLPAQVAAVSALGDPDYYRESYRQTHELRDALTRELVSLGWKVYPGVANFVLAELPAGGIDALGLESSCRAQGLFFRTGINMGRKIYDHMLRIAVKGPADNSRMIEILARETNTIDRKVGRDSGELGGNRSIQRALGSRIGSAVS